ncbi:uncharacterized protein [Haliotis cracherodii]|uniref:uncharacterized protein n=1 Tax=Haliotis cracherodii TaxID=6455 RepID=UPI0039ED49C5
MAEDGPPSYTDTMAAIAEGMRQQGIQTRSSLTTGDLTGDSGDFIVIFPPSTTGNSFRSVSSGSSFQSVDASLPEGPPPAYTDRPSPSSHRRTTEHGAHCTESSVSRIHDQRTPSLDAGHKSVPKSVSYPSSLKDATKTHRTAPLPQTGVTSDRNHFPGLPSAPLATSSLRHDAISTDGASEKPAEHDSSLPGRIQVEQQEYVITSSSPATVEIRWRVPDNADDFTGLVYVVETHYASSPSLSITPTSKPIDRRDDYWVEIIDTAKPYIRLFRTQSMLAIGHAKWALNQSRRTHGLKVWLRARAVDGYNRLPSCKKGPWSEEFRVQFIETGSITQSQQNAWTKSQEASMSTSDMSMQHKDAKPLTFESSPSCSLSTEMVNIQKLEYYIHSDSPTETQIKWERPSNVGKFKQTFYEVQSMQEPLHEKGSNTSRFTECARSESWKRIADTQSSPLRLYKFPKHISIGRTRWNFSPCMAPFTLLLRVRLVGMRQDCDVVSEGPWSDTVHIHVQAEKPSVTQ